MFKFGIFIFIVAIFVPTHKFQIYCFILVNWTVDMFESLKCKKKTFFTIFMFSIALVKNKKEVEK